MYNIQKGTYCRYDVLDTNIVLEDLRIMKKFINVHLHCIIILVLAVAGMCQ